MRIRLFLLFALAFALLSLQQAATSHALSHVLEKRQDQHSQHAGGCDKCASYAQLGGLLHAASHDHSLARSAASIAEWPVAGLPPLFSLAASARAPPLTLHQIV